MKKGMDKSALLLEQCRTELNVRAELGGDALAEMIEQAAQHAHACEQDWQQAQKTVELTANQQQAVEDSRKTGEEKLAQAVTEEDDARIAAETVQRMIDDATTVRCVANKDTAKILQRAETVLEETARRASVFYTDKKIQREEIEGAMMRLYATETAVRYTMAKAERNQSEKLLELTIAKYKRDICQAGSEALQLDAQQAELKSGQQEEEGRLEEVQTKLAAATQAVRQATEQAEKIRADADADIAACSEQADANLAAIDAENEEYELKRRQAVAAVAGQRQSTQARQEEARQAAENAAAAQTECDTMIARAREEYHLSQQELERELDQLRQDAVKADNAYHASLSRLDELKAEAEGLEKTVMEYAAKAEEAAAEEKSAREAAETARRLATSAVKIRESISSESAELLLHAQDVLMEAAASAQQLMDEKDILRQQAEKECNLMRERAAALQRDIEALRRHTEGEKAEWERAEQVLQDALQAADIRRQQLDTELAEKTEQAQSVLRAAEEAAALSAAEADQAAALLMQMEAELQRIEAALVDLTARKAEQQEAAAVSLREINAKAEGMLAGIAASRERAEGEVAQLEAACAAHRETLSRLAEKIAAIAVQISAAEERVNALIADGAQAISQAEQRVAEDQRKESAARQAAEETVARMGRENQARTERLRMLHAAVGPLPTVDEAANAALADDEITAEADFSGEYAMDEPAADAAEPPLMPEAAPSIISQTAAMQAAETGTAAGSIGGVVLQAMRRGQADEADALSEEELFAEESLPNEEGEPEEATVCGLVELARTAAAQETMRDEEELFAEESRPNEEGEPEDATACGLVELARTAAAQEAIREEEPLIQEEEPLIAEEEIAEAEIADADAQPAPTGELAAMLAAADDIVYVEEPLIPDTDEEELFEEESRPNEEGEPEEATACELVELARTTAAEEVMREEEELFAEESRPNEEGGAEDEKPAAAVAGDDYEPGIVDYRSLSEEEIEYTQRLEVLSKSMLERTLQAETPPAPDQAKNGYADWMANLAKSLDEEPEKAAPAAADLSADAEDAEATDSRFGRPLYTENLMEDDLPVIQEAVLQSSEADHPADNSDEEDELRISILNTLDEQTPKKKRRFPFF